MLILPSRRIAGSERFNGTTSKAVLTGGGVEQESGRATTVLAHVYKHGTGEGAIGTIYSRSSGSTQYLTLSTNPSSGRGFRFAANSTGIAGAPHVNTEDRMVTTGREWQHVAATWTGGLAASSMQAFVARDGEPLSRSVSGSQGGTTAVLDSGSATLNIGNRDDSARTWDGWIHYVARWDRVLDLSELLLAQRYGPEAVMNGLVMLYRDGRDWSPIGLSVTSTDILGGPAPSVRSMARRVPTFYSAGGGGSIYDVSISESVSASDSLSALAVFGGALSESASAADTLAASAALACALSEASSASDVVSAAAAYAGALSEASSASDAVSASASLTGALSESASAADALAASASFGSALSESVSAADSIDGSIGAATYAAELVESVSAADSLTAAVVYASAIVEAVTAQDAITASAVLGAVLAEVASASDSVGAALVLAAAISEAVSAADGWSGSVGSQVFEVELSEAVSASDAWVALGVLARHGVRGAKAVQTQMSTRANVQTARRYN